MDRKRSAVHTLPKIATGELRLQSMGVTEPTTGSDTTKIKTTRRKRAIITSSTVRRCGFLARISDLMILLVRTTPLDQVKRRNPKVCRYCWLI